MQAARQSKDEIFELIRGYIESVLSGERVVGKYERLAVERQMRDLEAVESGERTDIKFVGARGLRFLEFCTKYVRHTKGPAARQRLRICERSAWIAFVWWCVFGWYRWNPERKCWVRRFTTVYLTVARKNAKTFWMALVALYLLGWEGEAGAEIYAAATKRDQAKRTWSQAEAVRKADSYLRKTLSSRPSTSTMYTEDDSTFMALGRDKDSHDGFDVFAGLVDELHEHKDRSQWDVLESGTGGRLSPLMIGGTTAGAKKAGLWWDLDHDGQRMLEQLTTDDAMFAFIARLDEGDDWADESVWPKANPNIDVSVDREKLRIGRTRALNNPRYLNEYLRKHMNLPAQADTAWMPIETWDACASDWTLERIPRGTRCWVGFDVSAVRDFTAASAVFPIQEGVLLAVTRMWIPSDRVVDRVKQDKIEVDRWIEQGWVHTTDGEMIDQDAIKQWLLNLRERFKIVEVPYDPYEAWKLASELQKLRFKAVMHRQGFISMSPPMKETERLIRRGARTDQLVAEGKTPETPRLVHDGNPAMRWMMSNVSVRTDPAGLIKPDKDKSRDRIDGPVSMIMAVGRASVGAQGSVYDERDIRVVG